MHAVRDEQLRRLMGHIQQVALDRLPQEMDTTPLRTRSLRRIADAARALASDADQILLVQEHVSFDPEEREAFSAYARKLACQAAELASAAEEGDVDRLSTGYQRLTTTCTACHAAFRGLPPI